MKYHFSTERDLGQVKPAIWASLAASIGFPIYELIWHFGDTTIGPIFGIFVLFFLLSLGGIYVYSEYRYTAEVGSDSVRFLKRGRLKKFDFTFSYNEIESVFRGPMGGLTLELKDGRTLKVGSGFQVLPEADNQPLRTAAEKLTCRPGALGTLLIKILIAKKLNRPDLAHFYQGESEAYKVLPEF